MSGKGAKRSKELTAFVMFLFLVTSVRCIWAEPGRAATTPEKVEVRPSARDFHFGYGYGIPEPGCISVMSALGTSGVKFSASAGFWARIEPEPPVDGKHSYDWSHIDNYVSAFRSVDEDIYFIVKSMSNWACNDEIASRIKLSGDFRSYFKNARSRDWPPADKHLPDFDRFVRSLVERYDGDGNDDMPGLGKPIKIWGVGAEVQHKGRWIGTQKEYAQVLRTAAGAIRTADPRATVVLAGLNTGECLKPDGTYDTTRFECRQCKKRGGGISRKNIDFIRRNLKLHAHFDVVDFHANHSWEGIPDTVGFLKNEMERNGYRKPIWAGDMLSAPKVEHVYENSAEILAKLKRGDQETANWLHEEQARLSTKKIVTALAYGVERVFLELVKDRKKGRHPTSAFLGLLNDDLSPRPIYHAYRLIIEKLSGFSSVERLKTGGGVSAFRFTVNDAIVYVMWGSGAAPTEITGIVMTTDIHGKTETVHAGDLSLSECPMFVESALKVH